MVENTTAHALCTHLSSKKEDLSIEHNDRLVTGMLACNRLEQNGRTLQLNAIPEVTGGCYETCNRRSPVIASLISVEDSSTILGPKCLDK